MRLFRTLLLAAAVVPVSVMSPAEAQSWPTQPVRLVVPFAAGGSADLSARIVADELGRHLGQPVIVENRSGAGSSVGTGFVAASPPDGHTILYATSSFSYMKWLVPSLRFSPEADLTPVAVIGKNSYVLVTNNAFPARTFSEVVSTLRGNPGRYFYASAGIGSGMHFMFEYFLATAGGLRVTHVPYRGGGAAMTDLIAGQVQLMADPASSTIPHIAAGSVRPIAVTSLERLAVLPDVPTIAESGLPEFRSFEASGWLMALVPARTPSAVVAKINEAINKAITSEQGTRRLAEINIQVPRDNSPEAAARFLDREFRTWAEVARKSGIKPE